MLLHESFLFCWAAKWGDEKRVRTGKLTPDEVDNQDDSRIAGDLADLVRDADIVVAHNADRFDVPRLNTRLLLHELEPLGPVQSIDTLKLAKKSFGLTHNRLDHLARILGLGSKLKTEFELWEQVYNGDEVALQRMLRYCKHDVVLLEQVYEKMRPYVKGLGRLVDAAGEVCPSCGSDHFQRRGYQRTNASTFTRFQCQSCSRYFRSRKAVDSKRGAFHPL
jgi:uncharacterized protein YprB with RNaseH-like and TPR domain